LAVGFEQCAAHVHSLASRARTFEREPQKIHAKKAWLSSQLLGKCTAHRLVPTDNTTLIGAHFAAP